MENFVAAHLCKLCVILRELEKRNGGCELFVSCVFLCVAAGMTRPRLAAGGFKTILFIFLVVGVLGLSGICSDYCRRAPTDPLTAARWLSERDVVVTRRTH